MTDSKPTTTHDDYLGDAVYIGRVASANTNEFVLWTERWSDKFIHYRNVVQKRKL